MVEFMIVSRILSNSISAVYLILAVVVLRALFRKAPAMFRCALWGLVALRLVLPFDIQIDRGILPSGEAQLTQITESVGASDFSWIAQDGSTGVSNGTGVPGGAESSSVTKPINETEARRGADTFSPFFLIWLTGVLVMLGYLVWQYIALHRRLREAVREERIVDGEACEVYLAEGIQTPFLFGIFRPRIYLPYRTQEDYTAYVLRHEQMHRKRFDHVKKTESFMLLGFYWFHPLVWLAYILYGRDLELACDECVIRDYDLESRKRYSKALLYFAVDHRRIQISPLAFGEVGIRARIQNVLRYKKPVFWGTIVAVIVVLGAFGIFFLNRGSSTGVNDGGDMSDPAGDGQVAGEATDSMQMPGRVAQEFLDYLEEQGSYVIAVKALSDGYHYDEENKYYYEIIDYVPAMNDAGTAFAWGPRRAVFPADGKPLNVWEQEDAFRTDWSKPGFHNAKLRLAKDCAYYACYAFSQGAQDEDRRRISWEMFYSLFMENKSYDEVYCSVQYQDGEVTELVLLSAYPTLKTGDDFLGTMVDETDFTEAVRADRQQDGMDGSRGDTLYRTRIDGQDYLLELVFYSANDGRSYVTYRIYQCEELSRNAFSAVYVDGCHFEVKNARISGYPAKDMEAFYNAIVPYVQNSDGKWNWGDGTFQDGDYAVYDLGKFWEMYVLTAEHINLLRAQQYTLIQDTRIENPYFSLTVPAEFVGKVGYQISVNSVAKNFSVTFVLDEAAEKVTRYGMLGEYEQLQETGRVTLGWVSWQDLKDIVWLDKGADENVHASFILACLDEVDFERAWPMYSLLFGYGGERNAVCYNQDKSGAYCAFVPTDVQYDPENPEVTKQYLAFSALYKELMENGDFETARFPFARLSESERDYLEYVKEKYGTEDAVIWFKKSEPYNYEIAKEQGWLPDGLGD